MKLTKDLETEIKQMMDDYWDSYLKGDLKTWSSYLPDNYRNIGTTQEEIWSSKQDIVDYSNKVINQLMGMADLRNKQVHIIPFDPHIMVHELGDMYIKMEGGWNFYAKLRLSSLLEKTEAGWKILHQHGSYPDSKAEEGETFAFDKISQENLELREAIKRRTVELEQKNRELEIEGALERIRAQAVAMKESSDLLDIVVTMRNEFTRLGHEAHYFWHMMWLQDKYEKAMTSGDGSRIGMVMELPRDFHTKYQDTVAWENSNEPIHILAMDAETAVDYVDRMITQGNFQQVDPNAPSLDDVQHIGGLTFVMARTTHGEIGYSLPGVVKNPPAEDLEILERFAGAFDLAHRRFLDLQKAEAQAREVEIELALEKVRSRTMAMQHSSELAEASFLLDQQVRGLGIKTWGCAFNIYGERDSTEWFGNEAGILPTYTVPRVGIFKQYYQRGQKGESFFIKEIEGEECITHYEFMSTLPVVGDVLKQLKKTNGSFPTYQIDHVVYFKYGYLLFITRESVPEAHHIFKRFAKVFEQTYTRFLDLQKAEAQAREAQIELGLERVRARAMAMQTSEELNALIGTVFTELTNLDLLVTRCLISIFDPETHASRWWLANSEVPLEPNSFYIPYHEHPPYLAFLKAWKAQAVKYQYVLEGEGKKEYDTYLFSQTELSSLPDFVKEGMAEPDSVVLSQSYNNFGFIHASSLEPLPNEHFDILLRFAKVFDLTYTRFNDLKQAEAQTREAQIENALEKVRSRTMAMQKSEELPEAANDLFLQIQALGIPAWSAGYCIWKEDKKSATAFMSSEGVIQKSFVLPSIGVGYNFFDPLKDGKTFSVQELGGEEIVKHYEFMRTLPVFGEIIDGIIEAGHPLPTFQIFHIVYFKYGYVMFITYEPVPEAHDIFKRFAKVFEQTYTRFLDLQKAEAQVREAQIENALEKVRSRTMGMHKSEELREVIQVVYEQFVYLNIFIEHAGFIMDYKARDDMHIWLADLHEAPTQVTIPYFDSPHWNSFIEAKEKGKDFFENHLTFEEKNKFYKELFTLIPGVPEETKEYYFSCPGLAISTVLLENVGLYIENFSGIPYSNEENNTLMRFGKVFQQTYTRFLDLQKAEAQAKEAQIENALERVRSRSLAMHNSEELQEVVNTVAQELQNINIDINGGVFITINDEINRDAVIWGCGGAANYVQKAVIPFLDRPIFTRLLDAIRKREDFLVEEYTREEKIEFFEHLFKHPPWNSTHRQRKKQLLSLEGGYTRSLTVSANTSIFIINNTGKLFSDEDNDILKRFGKVFEQSYTRFLDLQKAEAQAREATKQASLDRVRGQIASMRSTEDLQRITPLVFNELTTLGVPFIRCGVFIIDEADRNVQAYLSAPDGHSLGVLNLPYHSNELIDKIVASWRKNLVYEEHWTREDFVQWTESMMEMGQVSDKKTYQGGDAPPQSLDLHFIPFKQGMLYVGNNEPLAEAEIDVSRSLADAFSIAYARYQDFTKLDAAKQKVEAAFADLEAAQDQLVQQEKLASLGQLTAGIAHEIKNPLNFVNNFSEVSIELIEEAKQEVREDLRNQESEFRTQESLSAEGTPLEEGGKDGGVVKGDNSGYILEILNDIEANLRKIHEHGHRADRIVKSMLQHSRKGSGINEPVNLNALVREFVNLAFHGMRASTHPINVDIQFNLDKAIKEVPLIAEDFSRVIVNLCNNAFDAMREKADGSGQMADDYTPKLTVRTARKDGNIFVEIEDNGPGILQEMRDRIMQPFFTTKKGTEGTGLGLYITNDIVKAHGGEIKVRSEEGEGSEFIIQLKINS